MKMKMSISFPNILNMMIFHIQIIAFNVDIKYIR